MNCCKFTGNDENNNNQSFFMGNNLHDKALGGVKNELFPAQSEGGRDELH